MTEQEAIRFLKLQRAFPNESNAKVEAIDMAIKALEKQIPKKPITYPKTNRADCPRCGTTVRGIRNPFGDYCSGCGQKLDWSEEE